MHVRRIRSVEDVEQLRLLRNECRKYMTGDTKKIGKAAQKAWWEEAPRRAYLLVPDQGGPAVAFSYVRWDDHRNWITLGVTESERGKGYGTLMYRHAGPIWARIRIDNEASIKAAQRAGYIAVESDGETVVMKRRQA